MSESLVERYAERIEGVVSCFDRVVLTGTLPDICHAKAMAAWLTRHKVRLFDYPRWAQQFREAIRENAERLAGENGLEIEFIRRNSFRKEERVKEIVGRRGDHPGVVHIFSAMEPCPSFLPRHDKPSGRTYLKSSDSKCLHYYFYFIDEMLGLCYLRVPTWAPFRLQMYFNGHNALAAALRKGGIGFVMEDNAFVSVEDFEAAQTLADGLDVKKLHRRLDRMARRFCPAAARFPAGYHWSMMQAEYATDVIFKGASDLAPLYQGLVQTAVQAVKAENVATFLGRKLDPRYGGEAGTDLNTRIEGTRIKHHLGPASIKMYDKRGRVLRVETTANDVSFFKHHRRVEHRDGGWEMKVAPRKKSIHSLPALAELLRAANRRYLEFISALEDTTAGRKDLERVARPRREGDRTWRGFNFFDEDDSTTLCAIARGEFTISGLTNRLLRRCLPGKTSSQIGRLLKRLRTHGLIKRVGRTYKYYLTRLGKRVVAAGLAIKELFLVPNLARANP